MPAASRRRAPPTQIGRDQWAEFIDPTPHGLTADLDPALGEQLLDVPDAEREPELQPGGVPDHVRREAVTLERNRLDQICLRIGLRPKTGEK